MTHFSFAIVGFDLDGTLVDTSADLAAALNHVLSGAGRTTLSVDQVRTMVGGGARHLLEQGLAATGGCRAEDVAPLYEEMLTYYAANISVHARPYRGVTAALDALAARGVVLAVVTNKLERLADELLRALALRDRFAVLIGGDTMGPGLAKPHRAGLDAMVRRGGGGRAAFVGDSRYDIEAAKNAGLPSIAVGFGFGHGPAADLGADAVIDSYDDLVAALERLA